MLRPQLAHAVFRLTGRERFTPGCDDRELLDPRRRKAALSRESISGPASDRREGFAATARQPSRNEPPSVRRPEPIMRRGPLSRGVPLSAASSQRRLAKGSRFRSPAAVWRRSEGFDVPRRFIPATGGPDVSARPGPRAVRHHHLTRFIFVGLITSRGGVSRPVHREVGYMVRLLGLAPVCGPCRVWTRSILPRTFPLAGFRARALRAIGRNRTVGIGRYVRIVSPWPPLPVPIRSWVFGALPAQAIR
jgi:hypothetical protein